MAAFAVSKLHQLHIYAFKVVMVKGCELHPMDLRSCCD